MPRVSLYGPRKTEPGRLPGARITQAGDAESYGAGFGNTMLGIGARGLREVQVARERKQELERTRMNEMIVLGAHNQLDTFEGEALHGENGAFAKKGKDAMGVYDGTMEAWNARADMIEATLTNDDQRIAFQRARASRGNAIGAQLRRHINSETERYDAQEYEGFIKNATEAAARATLAVAPGPDGSLQSAVEPALIVAKVDEAVAVTRAYAKRNGLGKEATEQKVKEVTTIMHGHVVDSFLSQDKTEAADAYVDAVGDQIDATVLDNLKAKINTAATDVKAEALADELWATMGPGGDDTKPVSLDVMEAEARKRLGNDVKTLQATRQALRARKQATDDGRRERDNARDDAVWGAVMAGSSFSDVRKMKEFIDNPDIQVKVRDYMDRRAEHAASLREREANRANAAESRAYTQMMRAEKMREMSSYGLYADLSDPARLSQMGRGEIRALLPTLGQENTDRLLRKHEELLKSNDTVRAATIDTDLFKSVAYDSGFQRIFESKKTPEERASEGRLRTRVEDAIAGAQVKAGRALTYDEKETLMRNLVTQQVVKEVSFGRDQPVVAAGADPKTSYVPLDEIRSVNAPALKVMVNLLRGSTAAYATKSDDQIIAAAQKRIERTYAAKRMGRTSTEQMNILLGKE